jgi:PleD family two-component response regulator
MRQALLNIVTAALQRVPGGELNINVTAVPQQLYATLRATRLATSRSQTPEQSSESERKGAELLRMAERLVQMSGGSLASTSEAGGLAVKLHLPTLEPAEILVIDDNQDTLQLLQRYLAGTRYRFVGLSDPERALASAAHRGPHLIILDVMLPGVDGWELLERLREHPRTSGIPVIICTILPQEELALHLGAAAFIRKPFNRQRLLEILDQQLETMSREYS